MRTSVDVHTHLVAHDIPHELVALPGRLHSPRDIAAVLELPVDQVGRVLIYESDRCPVAALIACHRAPDPGKVAASLGVDAIHAVGPSRVSQLTDYLHDAVPPVGLPAGFAFVADEALASQEVIYFFAGEAATILKIRGADLLQSGGVLVSDIAA